jgi:hypothetical protein
VLVDKLECLRGCGTACRGHASIMEIESTFRGHDRDL